MTDYRGGCNCAAKAPTVPTCRSSNVHLDDCPAKGSGFVVGETRPAPSIPNVIAQIAISGARHNGTTFAAERIVVDDIVELGIARELVLPVIDRAVEMGVVLREGQNLVIAR